MAKSAKRGVDSGYSWVILIATFFGNCLFDGIIFTFGIFYVEFLHHYGEGRGVTSWIGSVISGVYAIVGPLASVLSKKFGCRMVTIIGSLLASSGFILSTFAPNVPVMIFTYGIMAGTGFGLMYLCAYVMIGEYFDRWRALAMGIASCGSGVGTFVFAPMSAALIESFGWKGAMLIISAVILQGVVIGALYRPIEKPNRVLGDVATSEDVKTPLFDVALLTDMRFMLFCFSSFLCLIGMFIPFTFLPDYAISHGTTYEKAALLLSVIGITNTCARIICGLVSGKMDPLLIYIGALIIGGAAVIVIPFTTNYILLAVSAAVFGASIAAYVTLCALILIELLGLPRLSSSFGFLNMFRGLATFIGTPVAGFIYDITNSYQVAFCVAGVSIATAGLVCVPLSVWNRCKKNSYAAANKNSTTVEIGECSTDKKKRDEEQTESLTNNNVCVASNECDK